MDDVEQKQIRLPARRRLNIGGVWVDDCPLDEAVARCAALFSEPGNAGAAGGAEAAGQVLQARYPGLIIAGAYAGSPAPAEEAAITEQITAGQADLLFVAFGAPRQDLWIARNAGRLPTVRLAMGVGGVY